MRLVILKDKRIQEDDLNELLRQFTDLYYAHTGITPEYFIEEREYTNVPTAPDSDGDLKPTYKYRKALTDDVYKRYGEWGTDHVVMLVHRDNWIFKGIWGSNWSNIFHSYHFELVRFDSRNVANSLGTLYHEVHHSHDSLIMATLGVDVLPLLEVEDYDRDITHGKGAGWDYIRWKENTKSLHIMKPYLVQSYEKRKKLHNERISLMLGVITLAQKLIVLLRARVNQKDGKKE